MAGVKEVDSPPSLHDSSSCQSTGDRLAGTGGVALVETIQLYRSNPLQTVDLLQFKLMIRLSIGLRSGQRSGEACH